MIKSLDYELRPLEELIGQNVWIKKGKMYSFNQKGVIEETPYIPENNWHSTFIRREIAENLVGAGRHKCNLEPVRHAASRVKAGWTYEMLRKQLKESQALYKKIQELRDKGEKLHPSPTGIDAFVTRYEQPIFERTPENKNKGTFDFIKVMVGYVSEWPFGDRNAYIKKNIKHITKRVIGFLGESKRFQRFEVPVTALSLTKVLNRKDSTLEFIFELKKELREEKEEE